jgi:hypothetical protein
MRKRYHIDALNKSTFGVTYYDACSKPHSDAEKIANTLGFKSVYLYGSRLSKLGKPLWKKILLHIYNLCWQAYILWQARTFRKIKDADIFIQYGFSTEAMFPIIEKLKKNGNNIIMLIHDLDSLRFHGEGTSVNASYLKKLWRNEQKLLSNVDVIIAHSKPMMKRLEEIGFSGKVEILQFFDYLNDYKAGPSSEDLCEKIDIVFAGNLSKSTFLQKLHLIEAHPNFHFLLYGKAVDNIVTNNTVIYKGCFQNDDIAGVEGTWGLVWDGEEIDTCKGNFGEYLRINAPFKFSLYLAKGLPVIVWKESAMAYYVEEYGLGITVSSLNDIYDSIHHLSEEQACRIKNNVRTYSERVKKGMMLSDVLYKCISCQEHLYNG